MKRISCIVLCFALIGASITTASAASSAEMDDMPPLKIQVNGSLLAFTDAHPFIDTSDRTQVPLRALAESLGYGIIWNEEEQSILLYQIAADSKNASLAKYVIDEKNVVMLSASGSGFNSSDSGEEFLKKAGELKEKETVSMDTAPMLLRDRTYIPARYVAELFGSEVGWDEPTQTVLITTKKEEPVKDNTKDEAGNEDADEDKDGEKDEDKPTKTQHADIPATGLTSDFVGIKHGGYYYKQDVLPSGACVITSLSMIASNLHDKEITPHEIYAHNDNSVYVVWSKVETKALLDRERKIDFTTSKYSDYTWHDKLKEVVAAIEACPDGTLLSFINSSGRRHSVVATGYDPDTGIVYVNDPAYGENVPLVESWTGKGMFDNDEKEAFYCLKQIYTYKKGE